MFRLFLFLLRFFLLGFLVLGPAILLGNRLLRSLFLLLLVRIRVLVFRLGFFFGFLRILLAAFHDLLLGGRRLLLFLLLPRGLISRGTLILGPHWLLAELEQLLLIVVIYGPSNLKVLLDLLLKFVERDTGGLAEGGLLGLDCLVGFADAVLNLHKGANNGVGKDIVGLEVNGAADVRGTLVNLVGEGLEIGHYRSEVVNLQMVLQVAQDLVKVFTLLILTGLDHTGLLL